jgi:hypothetical protein
MMVGATELPRRKSTYRHLPVPVHLSYQVPLFQSAIRGVDHNIFEGKARSSVSEAVAMLGVDTGGRKCACLTNRAACIV